MFSPRYTQFYVCSSSCPSTSRWNFLLPAPKNWHSVFCMFSWILIFDSSALYLPAPSAILLSILPVAQSRQPNQCQLDIWRLLLTKYRNSAIRYSAVLFRGILIFCSFLTFNLDLLFTIVLINFVYVIQKRLCQLELSQLKNSVLDIAKYMIRILDYRSKSLWPVS